MQSLQRRSFLAFFFCLVLARLHLFNQILTTVPKTKVHYGEKFGICKVKLFMNDYVPAHIKIPQKKNLIEATQVTLLLLVVSHWYSVVGFIGCGLLVIGRWSLVRVTIGCNSISMQFYERPKTAINLY